LIQAKLRRLQSVEARRALHPRGGGALPIMAYTGRLRPKGIPFSGFKYIKGWGFNKFRYMEGQENLSSGSKMGLELRRYM